MAKIHVLDPGTINQIAAGEVVERPASVAKELAENAIDAGATAITVEIKDGGISLIRVTDNGAGIPKEDVQLAFCPHATSKILKAPDLLTVKSLGFRGEALSSIASIAKVELVTKTREEFTGSRYLIEGGEEKEFLEIGAPEGSTFLIRSLFYNTPARRKFLKSNSTEAGYVSDLMERLAIAHPETAFKFINNNKTILQTPGNGNLKDCIYHIFGRETAAALIEVQTQGTEAEISGFLGKASVSRGNRNYENYFLNGRYIKSSIISKAIEEAYKPYTMQHKYPFTVLNISIPPAKVDVNVHPAKLEVRFADGEKMYQTVFHTVKDALSGKNMIPDAILVQEKKQKETFAAAPEPFERNRLTYTRQALRTKAEKVREDAIKATLNAPLFQEENFSEPQAGSEKTGETPSEKLGELTSEQLRESISDPEKLDKLLSDMEKFRETSSAKENINSENFDKLSSKISDPVSTKEDINIENMHIEKSEQLSIFDAKETEKEQKKEAFVKEGTAGGRIIGQLFSTYWLVEFKEQLFLIDQHAAHEKILYEHAVKRLKTKEVMSQILSPPAILALSIREEEVLKRCLPQLKELGFEIESFGGREYSLCAVPVDLYGLNGQTLLIDMLDAIAENPPSGPPDMVLDRIASLSCKAAVKGNTGMSQKEAENLIRELLGLENPFHCPHGRPIIISMTKHEIEKKFKRIVT